MESSSTSSTPLSVSQAVEFLTSSELTHVSFAQKLEFLKQQGCTPETLAAATRAIGGDSVPHITIQHQSSPWKSLLPTVLGLVAGAAGYRYWGSSQR